MALTLGNYATALSPDLLQSAKKNKVRECDETEKGHFVAYVDEGKESYDVSVTLNAKNEITKHTCECDSPGTLCRHKTALIIFIAEGKKTKTNVKVKKKEGKTDTLLDEIDLNELKSWVKSLISKNKDIELAFIHHFSAKALLTPIEVAKIITDGVKAVVGNKKSADVTQIKKLVELWEQTLKPVSEYYSANITNEKAFLNFHTMLETCLEFYYKINTTSTRISKFIEDSLQRTVEPVSNLQFEEGWEKAIRLIATVVPQGKNAFRMHYLQHLKTINNVSSDERKLKIIDLLAGQFKQCEPEKMPYGAAYTKFIFELVNDNNLFQKYSKLFKPLYYENAYNEKLIRLLINDNELTRAKTYCEEQIQRNSKEEFSILYLEFLREIYTIQQNETELAKISAILFPHTFNFDDYLSISKRLPDEEREKWRSQMLNKARRLFSSRNYAAITFCFRLMDSEKNYRKMVDDIDTYTPYPFILQYFDLMAAAEKDRFLKKVLQKSDSYGWGVSYTQAENDKAYFPELFGLFKKHYGADYLIRVIKHENKTNRYTSMNNLFVYMKQQLEAENH